MPAIESGSGVVTHINVFTTRPDRQQALVESLKETVAAAQEVPGWLSASIHRSFDGRQVVNYVQFENEEAAQRVTQHLLARGLIQRNTALGTVAPGQYEVVHTLARQEGNQRD